MRPDISALLPVRNWDPQRVRMCINSLNNLEECQVEVVLVDYGSEDPEPLRMIADEYELVYIRTEAEEWSRAKAMNEAATKASGKFLLFIDADLVFAPTLGVTALKIFEKDPTQSLAFQARDLPSNITVHQLMDPTVVDFEELDNCATWRPRWGAGIQMQSRETFIALRGFDTRFRVYGGEDNDMARRVRFSGRKLQWINDKRAAIYHVWHPSSRTTVSRDPKNVEILKQNSSIAKHDTSLNRNLSEVSLSSSPLVSVVVLTHNRADFIADCIESILSQSMPDFELIILDDASTDSTSEVIAAFDDPRIRYFYEEKSSIPALRNKAAKVSRGRYTAIFDDDDIMLPWALESRLKAIQPGEVGAYGGYYDFDNETGDLLLRPGKDATLQNIICSGGVFCHASLLIETEVLLRIGYDNAFRSGSDYNLAARILRTGLKLRHCGEVIFLRRLHNRQVTTMDSTIQKASSYCTSFAISGYWGAIEKKRTREAARSVPSYEFTSERSDARHVSAYLPSHLVNRHALIEKELAESLEIVGIRGTLENNDELHEVVFSQNLSARDYQELQALNSKQVWLTATPAEKEQSSVQALIGVAKVATGKKYVTVLQSDRDDSFTIVEGIEGASPKSHNAVSVVVMSDEQINTHNLLNCYSIEGA